MRNNLIALATAGLAAALAGPAHADLVTNGSFESTSGYGQLGDIGTYNGVTVTDWSVPAPNGSYAFIFDAANDGTGVNGEYGNVALWDAPPASPDGGNFIGADPGFQNGAISQTINGLISGDKYTLTFYYAGAQQVNYSGPTQEGWQVNFGGAQQSTALLNNASQGFTGWYKETMTFTADSTSDLLSFLAIGTTDSGAPPFALLDGIQMNPVPEPSSIALFGAALMGLLGFAAWRRRKVLPAAL